MAYILYIGLGGFLGAISRFYIAGLAQMLSGSFDFPYGTISVNLLGCFAIGMLSYVADVHGVFSPEIRLFLFVGFLGSFTTFSTFENEVYSLIKTGQTLPAIADLAIHVLAGLAAVWVGQLLAIQIWR